MIAIPTDSVIAKIKPRRAFWASGTRAYSACSARLIGRSSFGTTHGGVRWKTATSWAFARDLEGTDEAIDASVEKGKGRYAGFELPGRTLGVIGLGAVGVQVCNSAEALGMKVLGYDPQITVQRAWQLSSSVQQALSLDDLFARSDIVSVHVPMLEATRGLINGARLRLMRPGGAVLNFARAPIVNEAELVADAFDLLLRGEAMAHDNARRIGRNDEEQHKCDEGHAKHDKAGAAQTAEKVAAHQ